VQRVRAVGVHAHEAEGIVAQQVEIALEARGAFTLGLAQVLALGQAQELIAEAREAREEPLDLVGAQP
jgi:hypothetical protein